MNAKSPSTNLWRDLMRDAIKDEPVAAGPHFCEDDDFLNRWENAQLVGDEHRDAVAHLARCAQCRDVISMMVRQGAFQPSLTPTMGSENDLGGKAAALAIADSPELSNTQSAETKPASSRQLSETAPTLPNRAFDRRRLFYIACAAAACLVVAATLWPDRSNIRGQLALVEDELGTDPSSALQRLERLAEGALPGSSKSQLERLAERAGYETARKHLIQGQFTKVASVRERVQLLGANSGRLENLRMQAERGVSGELALSTQDHLRAYDYLMNGRSLSKSIGAVADADAKQWEQQLRKAIESFPDNANLRLNLGHFLLTQRRCDESKEQFDEALKIESNNLLAHLGLGLSAFEWEDIEQALVHFQNAIDIAPRNFAAQLNTAITLERLKRPDEARPFFLRAKALATTDKMKAEIDQHVARRAQ